MFELIKSGLSKQNIYNIISSGVVITGGVSQTSNIDDLARQYFGLPVRIGTPMYSGDFADMVSNPKYATSLGVLYFASEYMLGDTQKNKLKLHNADSSTILGKFKSLFK